MNARSARATSGLAAAPLALMIAGCAGGNDVSSTPDSWLVHEVTVVMDGTQFSITSELRNTGDAPVELEARACFLQSSDLRGETGGVEIYEPLIQCAADTMMLTLAPGESSEPLVMEGRVVSGGSQAVELRHALDPEIWSPLSLGGDG